MSETYQWQRDLHKALHGYFAEEDGLFVWHPPVPVFGKMVWGSITYVASPESLAKAVFCLAMLIAGCQPAPPEAPKPDLRPFIASAGMYALMDVSPAPLPPAPTPGAQCENCRGAGIVGDKVTGITCPICKGTGVTPNKAPVPTVGVVPEETPVPPAGVSPPVITDGGGPVFRIVCEDGKCRRIQVRPSDTAR
jgi:hypothetical protein